MKVQIKQPCPANWNEMRIGINSRHCELCVKPVMDFTQMSREDILIHLFQNRNQSTCARIMGNQIDFHFHELEAIIEGSRKEKGNKAFLILALATLALVSCTSDPSSTNSTDLTLGEVVCVEQLIDSSQNSLIDTFQAQKPVEEPTTTSLDCRAEDSIDMPLKGEVDISEIIMGDVIVESPEIREEAVVLGKIETPNIEPSTTDTTVFEFPEKMPEFVGGVDSLMSYLSDHVSYPELAKKKEVQGKVYVSFVVNKDGSISQSKLIKGIGAGCDEEALRVIQNMPKWLPGENRDEKVRVRYRIPIKFVLK